MSKGLVYTVYLLIFDVLVAVRGVRHTEVYLVIDCVVEDADVERVPIGLPLLEYFRKNRVLGTVLLYYGKPKRKFAKEVRVEVHRRTSRLCMFLERFVTLLIKVLQGQILLHLVIQYMWIPYHFGILLGTGVKCYGVITCKGTFMKQIWHDVPKACHTRLGRITRKSIWN